MKDLFGQAILDYQTGNDPQDLITETSISEPDEMSVAYLFRSFEDMPKIEQKALTLAHGKILDVGCGAGSHSLYLEQNGLDVTPIDISPSAIKACQLRGLPKATVADVLDFDGKFDTLLLLMNGTGIFGRYANITRYLQKLKSLLAPGGQILIDSSDIIYMFDQDEDGGHWIDTSRDYYGELTFHLTYKGLQETPFDWLYLDFNTLQTAANANGLQCDLVLEGDHYDYLARLTPVAMV
ncbi:class I SAM-dependent methyltransferase [Flavobacterium caeni]|uniref:Methyltransferase domain-containing protein n=1 Tax=Flavobacterium caeni TaxID=490189 RepID=A0A1G5JU27_9FLAO|nr:class I SAM-dependent methyltransferase [Flavobacterium caeni]SCY91952.1 Methyltransferase domain-containing protein [Flavobacterium caeni]